MRGSGRSKKPGWRGCHDEDACEAWNLQTGSVRVIYRKEKQKGGGGRRTISDNRASPGSNVGGASLCLSIASKTRTSLHLGSLVGSLSIVLMATHNCAKVSHRLCLRSVEDDSPKSPSDSRASATEPTMRSNKCRPVMHCAAFTVTCLYPPLCDAVLIEPASRTSSCSVMLDFPVASVPWRTMFRHCAPSGCEEWTTKLVPCRRNHGHLPHGACSYMHKCCERSDLMLPAWEARQQRGKKLIIRQTEQ